MLDMIRKRRSVRRFQPDAVEEEKIRTLVDCARMAPSARNVQPWKFVAITDPEALKKLGQMADTGPFVARAPLAIAVFCRETKYFLEDGCAATQNLLLAAEALGLGGCWIAGDKKAYAQDIARFLQAPEDFRLVSLLALGYPAEHPAEKAKKPLDEVLVWENFS